MQPNKLKKLIQAGKVQKHPKEQVIYSLDFKEELYIVKSGYVKRYQVTDGSNNVIESIYGPGYFFPLTQVYKRLLNFGLSQEDVTYIYQAMTDVEIQGINSEALTEAAKNDPDLYIDLFYEAGRRLKANINRLASNALKNDYQKVTHQLVYLAEEFGKHEVRHDKQGLRLMVPLQPKDMAEQLNISVEVADAVMNSLTQKGLLTTRGSHLIVPDLNLLKDAYL